MEFTAWSQDLTVEVAGHGVVSHAGSAVVRMIADGTGLTAGLSQALHRRGFVPVHDRGRVLTDAAVMIADGGRVLSDLATLRDQGELFRSVAWRSHAVAHVERDRLGPARPDRPGPGQDPPACVEAD